MPIPDFNSHGVLPPFDGDLKKLNGAARNPKVTSPYPATTMELCQRFGTTPERCQILKGFLGMRALMHQLQLVEGFQWVDGRFLEKDGKRNGRPLDHIQVVTFFHQSPLYNDPQYSHLFTPFKNARKTRAQFSVDHGFVNLAWSPLEIINSTRHWSALFSHQLDTGIWKGMLEISLHTLEEDAAALQHLKTLEKP
jgi:hypothetical protein